MNSKTPEVVVMMSTYNGVKYLDEQIKSILDQKNVCLKLIIRDDGSTDATYEILKKYAEANKDKIILLERDGNNLGSANGFMYLLNYALDNMDSNINFFAFADQDDFWLDEKLYHGVLNIEGTKKPALYYSKKIIVDQNLNKLNVHDDFFYEDSFLQFVTVSNAYVCTFVFNRKLAEMCRNKPQNGKIHHDAWIYRIAGCTGAYICRDKQGYILYRQHQNNVVGKVEYWTLKKGVHRLLGKRNHILQNTFREINNQCRTDFTVEAQSLVPLICNYTESFVARFKLLKWKTPYKYGMKKSLIWIFKVLSNGI